MIDISILRSGDTLLYKGSGIFSRIIQIKTWHTISHCEVYVGDLMSVASRDGKGSGRYPLRTDGLAYVLRPLVPFQLKPAMDWFYRHGNGQRYGWLDLLQFAGLNINAKGVICSTFATDFLRAGAVPVFNRESSQKIAPFQFLTSELLAEIWPESVEPEAAA